MIFIFSCTGRTDQLKKSKNPMDLLMSQVKNIGKILWIFYQLHKDMLIHDV